MSQAGKTSDTHRKSSFTELVEIGCGWGEPLPQPED
jgi:hypothetical protein